MKRWEWLADLINANDWRTGVEIGVKAGQTSFYLMESCPSLQLVAVDPWQPQPRSGEFGYLDWPHEDHETEFMEKRKKYRGRLTALKMTSAEAAPLFDDNYFDFAFIDGDHSCQAVRLDISAWLPKIRTGGFLTGHDVNFAGVKKALDECLPKYQAAGHDRCWFWQIPTTR